MADKGFNIKDELASVGAVLEIPSFLKKGTQFTEEEINKNKAIASLRIHVERQMERIKNWHILDRRMPITMAPYASDKVVIISALANFLPPLFLKFYISHCYNIMVSSIFIAIFRVQTLNVCILHNSLQNSTNQSVENNRIRIV